MKHPLRIALIAGICVGAVALPQGQDKAKTLEKRVQQLETELHDVRTELDRTVGYLRENARATAGLAKALDSSESLGFTKGINPNSREVMLNGFRKWIAATQSGLPLATPKAKPVEARQGKAK